MLYEPGPIVKLVPDGHFYSPLVDPREVEQRKEHLWPEVPPLRGIDYREAAQHALFEELAPLIRDFDFPPVQGETPGYFFHNNQFGGLDALMYFGMLRKLRPQRLLEIGAGFSTMLAVETKERFLGNERPLIACVEPYPTVGRAAALIGKVGFIAQPVQDVDPACVDELEAGDVLFIDCSHVSKTGSDVHTIYFDLLPRLVSGVYVQIHDMSLPFEYPHNWVVQDGRHWNEQYLVQALLTDSTRYVIEFGSAFFGAFHRDAIVAAFGYPYTGGSLWLRVADGTRPRRSAA